MQDASATKPVKTILDERSSSSSSSESEAAASEDSGALLQIYLDMSMTPLHGQGTVRVLVHALPWLADATRACSEASAGFGYPESAMSLKTNGSTAHLKKARSTDEGKASKLSEGQRAQLQQLVSPIL